MEQEKIMQAVRLLLEGIGEDPEREGLSGTPGRIVRMSAELFSGYGSDASEHLSTRFTAPGSGMVIERGIRFYSVCEHHLLPFFGQAAVAYLPGDEVVGLSKIARTVEVYARRLQLQERMTGQIADAFMRSLSPRGVLVVTEARHLCMEMRGVAKPDSTTLNFAARGEFESDAGLRAEAFRLLGI